MIVPMHKVTLLCLGQDVDTTLAALREMGVLHLTHTVPPQGDELTQARTRLEQAEHALQVLTADSHPVRAHPVDGPAPEAREIPALVEQLLNRRKAAEDRRTQLHNLIEALAPYGEFNPELIRSLAADDISVRLFQVPAGELPPPPEGAFLAILREQKDATYVVLVGAADADFTGTEFPVPQHALSDLRKDVQDLEEQAARDASELHRLRAATPELDAYVKQLHERVGFAEAQAGMTQEGRVSYLQGFCPHDQYDVLQQKARDHGWGLVSEKPADDEPVPTLLRYPGWVRPIKAMYEGLSILPGYHEADISAVFLVFFSIFFALLIGDAGYGVLFLLATLWMRKKRPKAPAYPFVLFGILSTCTIIWGAATGNYFGLSPDRLPGILHGIQIPWLTGADAQENVMRLCFLIGAVHLTIAHIWNAISLAPSPRALAELGWIAVAWCMFMVALNMVLQVPLPGFFIPMLLVGVALVVLFMTPPKQFKTDWIHHAMLPLSVVNCFVDIVSYIRLFAVGLASLSVAQSFNGMAADVGIARIWTVPFFALILLLGHGLNIILCALGILVHGVRLNTLEFSLHKNMEWKGFAYRPFSRQP